MTEMKTKQTDASVASFLEGVADEQQRADAQRIDKLMRRISGTAGKMWGGSIVGYGDYHYKYESGREGDWFLMGFSPRKGNLTLYIMPGFDRYAQLLQKLGKIKTGKSCLYIKKLADVDFEALTELVEASYKHMKAEVDPIV